MNIYFICTGNTCRSPMAEAILKNKDLKNVNVRSAGIYALEGDQMSENSSAILNQENIQHQHLSRQINSKDVAWADLILTMTAAHKEVINRTFEEAFEKTYTLKEYATPYSTQDVFDPFGGDIALYKQTFEELKRAIDELEEKIVMGGKIE
ncbi:low molecular weight phosphatase family protein [Solibacillus sp. R5-41]|uniref:low molecular weight protein arginine phosphatase n=1 Tax=Solibacillus sp. R5-41 TaxID=2048654 RepID=UPI000C1250BF|nr:low molecular weight protein arginine phosphatase [Solibacillus sp. R5-41]ATP42347.1 low molecular weight phosphatase family protein [Solibacillus sp. R5-41]